MGRARTATSMTVRKRALAHASACASLPSMPDRNRLVLEHIAYDIERLQRQAAAIGQDLLAYLLDQAATEARHQLARSAPEKQR